MEVFFNGFLVFLIHPKERIDEDVGRPLHVVQVQFWYHFLIGSQVGGRRGWEVEDFVELLPRLTSRANSQSREEGGQTTGREYQVPLISVI